MSANPPAALPPSRCRFSPRLHWFSWILLAALTSAMAIIALPAMPSKAGPEFRPPSPDLPMPAPFTLVQTWEHGWPWPYLSRGVVYSWSFAAPATAGGRYAYDLPADRTVPLTGQMLADEPIAWTTRDAWDFAGGEAHRFSAIAAVGDLAIGLAVIGLLVALAEWRFRRRGGMLRWTLADVLVGCTLLTCGIGWVRFHQSRHEAHGQVYGLIEKFDRPRQSPGEIASSFLSSLAIGRTRNPSASWDMQPDLAPTLRNRFLRPDWRTWRFDGPEWLARLVGSREVLRWCWRLASMKRGRDLWSFGVGDRTFFAASDDLSDIAIASPDCLIEDLQPLVEVDALRRLTLCISATEQEAQQFAADELQGRVTIDPVSRFAKADSVALRRIRRHLGRPGSPARNADPRNLTLTSLTMTDELMTIFAPFIVEHARKLTFGPTAVTHEGWRVVGSCQNLEYLDTGDAILSGRELALLRPLLLRELTLRQGDLTVDDLAMLAEMKSLVALTVRETTFNEAEQKRLQTALSSIDVELISTEDPAEPRPVGH